MSKNKIIALTLSAVVASSAMASVAFAREDSRDGVAVSTVRAESMEKKDVRIYATSSSLMISQIRDREHATSSATTTREREHATSSAATSTAQEKENKGRGDEHRSVVATFVKTLLEEADRTGGLGERVRMIAHDQASSTEKVAVAIDKVEKRNGVKTFLIGSDYKNLGAIRSEIAQTENRLSQLNREIGNTASSTEKDLITAQIKTLEQEQTKLTSFVTVMSTRGSPGTAMTSAR